MFYEGLKEGSKQPKLHDSFISSYNFTGKKLHCKLKFLKLLFESLSLTHARSILQIQLKFLSISLNEQFLSEMHLQFYFHLLFMKMHKRLYSQYPISVTELLCFRFQHSLNCCWCCHSGRRLLASLYLSTNYMKFNTLKAYQKQVNKNHQLIRLQDLLLRPGGNPIKGNLIIKV